MAARNTNLSLLSFFKIMMDDFSTKLRVPPEFVKNFKHKTVSRNFTVTLRPELKLSWKVKVKVERSSNGSASGDYYFTKGWSKMVKDLELADGDFLVFYLVAEDSFQLAVYDPTCCQKKITPPPLTTSNKQKPVDYNAGTSQPNPEHVLERTISKGYLSHSTMAIPWSFVQRNFNSECTELKITLITEDGQSWPVNLHSYPEASQAKICGGFTAFLKENRLEVGDKCKFELINREQNVFMVSIRRVGQKKNKKKQIAA